MQEGWKFGFSLFPNHLIFLSVEVFKINIQPCFCMHLFWWRPHPHWFTWKVWLRQGGESAAAPLLLVSERESESRIDCGAKGESVKSISPCANPSTPMPARQHRGVCSSSGSNYLSRHLPLWPQVFLVPRRATRTHTQQWKSLRALNSLCSSHPALDCNLILFSASHSWKLERERALVVFH